MLKAQFYRKIHTYHTTEHLNFCLLCRFAVGKAVTQIVIAVVVGTIGGGIALLFQKPKWLDIAQGLGPMIRLAFFAFAVHWAKPSLFICHKIFFTLSPLITFHSTISCCRAFVSACPGIYDVTALTAPPPQLTNCLPISGPSLQVLAVT
jgi:hypothetical protein